MSKRFFVRSTTTVIGAYRNKGLTHHFQSMANAAEYLETMKNEPLKSIKAFRLVPVSFTSPEKAAKAVKATISEGTESGYNW